LHFFSDETKLAESSNIKHIPSTMASSANYSI